MVAGLNVDKDPSFVMEYLNEVGARFVNFADPDRSVSRDRFGVTALPTTVVLSAEGAVLETIVGAEVWDSPAMIARLESLAGFDEGRTHAAR
jgi:hypothetical protein